MAQRSRETRRTFKEVVWDVFRSTLMSPYGLASAAKQGLRKAKPQKREHP